MSPPTGPLVFPRPPLWASEFIRRHSDAFALVDIHRPGVRLAEGFTLESLVEEAYLELLEKLPFPAVRIWNYLPRIVQDDGEGQDRYMRFNAGRYRAFVKKVCSAEQFERALPAGSAVGHAGLDLVIHALACRHESVAVANPRQRPPHQYSPRYGPKPPCFARARLIHSNPRLLVIGGTASIRGEESVRIGDLQGQLTETAQNLSSLISAAFGGSPQPLAHLTHLRVYYVNACDRTVLEKTIARWFSATGHVEWIQADLCRRDLLVEIEGIASAS